MSTAHADLYLTDGQSYSLGPLVSSENIYIANATTVSIAGDVTSSGSFNTGTVGGGNNLVNVSGTFNNSGTLTVSGAGDVVNLGALNSTGTVNLNAGTLNITGGGPGITDIPSTSSYFFGGGSFYFINNGHASSALANLASIEGNLSLYDGASYSFGSISNSGYFKIASGTSVSVAGNLSNSGLIETGYLGGDYNTINVSGTFTNTQSGTLELTRSTDVVNLNALSNQGAISLNAGTLNITGGGPGITDIPSTSSYFFGGGSFYFINNGHASSALANLASIEGNLSLYDGASYSFGSISNSGYFKIASGTSVSVAGNLSNSGLIETGYLGGDYNTINVSGTFTNTQSGTLELTRSTDVVNLNALSNQGAISLNAGTLNITGGGPGITDIPSTSSYYFGGGSFYFINNGHASSALANLASVEGNLSLYDGASYSFGSISNSGYFKIASGTSVSVAGNLSNSGLIETGYLGGDYNTINVSGTFTNTQSGTLELTRSTDVVNLNALSNQGAISLNAGTLNITGGGPGITDIPSTSSYYFGGGSFYFINNGHASSALANLASVEGNLSLYDGASYSFGSISNSGYFKIASGTSVSVAGNLSNSGLIETGYLGGDYNTINVSGTFTNTQSGTLELTRSTDVVNLSVLVNQGSVAINAGTLRVGLLINYGVISGPLNFSGDATNSGNVTIGGNQNIASGSTFNNNGGTATFTSDAGAAGGTLLLNVTGGTVKFTSTQHLLGLSIGSGSAVQVAATTGQRSIVYTPSLSVAGTLDLTNNDLDVQAGGSAALAAVTSLVHQGYANGTWTGTGITSSTAAADSTHLTALGVILNTADGVDPLYANGAPLGLFDGASPSASDILVKYTYYGDTDLKGYVDGSDYSRIDNGHLQNLTGWFNGDFNYDGVVNGSDYTLIDNAFNEQGAALSAEIAQTTAEIAPLAESSVPEPVSVGLLAFGCVGVLGRRRR